MQPIALPFRLKMKLTLDPSNGGGQATWNPDELSKRKDRGLRVISAALAIENLINEVLKKTLFREIKNDLDFVSGQILESDKLSFSAKRKLLFAIIERDNLICGREKSKLEKDLCLVMNYRNAFAHGSIEIHGNDYILVYFNSKQKCEILNDEFWSRIEKIFNDPFSALLNIETQLESPTGA